MGPEGDGRPPNLRAEPQVQTTPKMEEVASGNLPSFRVLLHFFTIMGRGHYERRPTLAPTSTQLTSLRT